MNPPRTMLALSPSPPRTPHRSAAFSLVEMLVVIAVIGIIASLAIPGIGDFSDTAKDTTARRNAQNLGSLSSNLATTGMEHVIPDSLGGVEATVRLLKHGVVVTEGPLTNTVMGMQGLDDDQVAPASAYLQISFAGMAVLRLIYTPDAAIP